MDTEEEDTSRTPKKKIIEEEGQLVQVTKEDKGKKKMKVTGPSFEVKEYAFADTPADSTSQFKNKTELLEKYKETKDISSEESLKLYSEVRKSSTQDVSIIVVRDYSQNTLNLALATKNTVAKMKMDLENILVLDMIHLHKKTWDILFTDP